MIKSAVVEHASQLPLNARGAVISDCGTYRYWLERWWAYGLAPMVFVMCNPSTADAYEDDATIRRCMGFARAHRLGGIIVVNALAYRATAPDDLPPLAEARGPQNARYLEKAATCGHPVFAWGVPLKGYEDAYRDAYFSWWTYRRYCLGVTKDGHPRHPLRLPKSTHIQPWSSKF